MNNKYIAPANINIDYLPLIKLGSLPNKLTTILRQVLDAGYDHSFLAHVLEISYNNLEMAIRCSETTGLLKTFQLCMLRKTGMNLYFIHLFECMKEYERWRNITPIINGERRMLNGDVRLWNLASFINGIYSANDDSLKMQYEDCLITIKDQTA